MKTSEHLDTGLLILAIDEELAEADRSAVEAHLSACADCKARYHELAILSVRLESVVAAIPVEAPASFRDRLAAGLDHPKPNSPLMSWRVGWGMAIAAGLALGLVFLPHRHEASGLAKAAAASAAGTGTFELDGETFVSLPYSNSDLPVSAPRIVRMQMPVSALADAGLVFEPVSTETARPDRSVLADVLLGADGEPLGVHVVANE
ncbi:MAG: zf-HC2 domain-containing protein [Acidobacteriota bacterium]|nr:zf-HC2 domain-containing protein [Acidobacteriota bacterium]